jgi:phosphoribosylanthranilate isomerase
MTWVKICGITNLEDALIAVDAGADALGFVFYEKSPRKVSVETARAIVAEVPERVEKVGVFVEQSAAEIRQIVQGAGLTTVQAPSEAFVEGGLFNAAVSNNEPSLKERWGSDKLILGCQAEGLRYLFLSEQARKKIHAVLVDSGSAVTPGGTGKTFDWEQSADKVKDLGRMARVIVAGGLKPDNVSEAMRLFESFGVDVASGVEAKPGKKDPEKVRAFVRAVRLADQKVV